MHLDVRTTCNDDEGCAWSSGKRFAYFRGGNYQEGDSPLIVLT